MNEYDLPEGMNANDLNEGMKTGTAIQLPFEVPYLYVVNGDSRLKQLGNVPYFGGIQADYDQFIDAGASFGKEIPPHGFVEADVDGRDNKALHVFQSRNILLAPIAIRKSWFSESNGVITRNIEYFSGARQHLQVLAHLGSKEEGRIISWGPAVLSAKGFQVNNITDALAAWKNFIDKNRKMAGIPENIPAWCFYMSLGTFGDKQIVKQVGKTGAQSSITPVMAYVPEKADTDLFKKLYVGKDVVEEMLIRKTQATEWLGAWGKLTPKAEERQKVSDQEPPEEDDQIPF